MLYSLNKTANRILDSLLQDPKLPLLQETRAPQLRANLVNDGSNPPIPSPFLATEAVAAVKALEGTVASALAKERFGDAPRATVDVFQAVLALSIHDVSVVEGAPPFVFGQKLAELPAWLRGDLNNTMTNVYRNSISNMYKTKDDKYFHLHGGLNATPTFEFLGLPPYNDDISQEDAVKLIQSRALLYTAAELETMADNAKQSGAIVFTREEFLASPHGQHIAQQPLFSLETLETSSPPLEFVSKGKDLLTGIKILDVTRAIAGPIITRTLAEYGADVLHVCHKNVPEVPYDPIAFNVGKRSCDLNLKDPKDRATFEALLDEADVLVDGYRPGVLERLGYGKDALTKRFETRQKGFIYVAENCYGWGGPLSHRSGWQQIADCVAGMSWAQGLALGKNEPIDPPLAMADYGCGAVGCVAVLNALLAQALRGGSYYVTSSLTQYNHWLMSLGTYPAGVWEKTRTDYLQELKDVELNHYTPCLAVFKATSRMLRRLHPHVFKVEYFYTAFAETVNTNVKTYGPCVQMKYKNGWLNPSRLDGTDPAEWRKTI